MNKKTLSERDICTKFITPAIVNVEWKLNYHFCEELTFNTFTDGKIGFRGKLNYRSEKKRADYILYYKPNIPIAIIEAKANNHSERAGIQQALDFAIISYDKKVIYLLMIFIKNYINFIEYTSYRQAY